MSSPMSDDDPHHAPHDAHAMMVDDQHSPQANHTGHDQHTAAVHLSSIPSPDGQPTVSRLTASTSLGALPQPFSPPPPHPTPHPALLAAVPSSAPSSSSPSSLSSRVNTFRSACLDCLISHQTHHLIPHSSKVVIFDSKLKVAHAFDGLVTHDINCFPESDTRVLTDRGFAFLDEIEARLAAGESVLYGCYEVASKRLVYRPGKLVFDTRAHEQLVSITSPDESRRWVEGSDVYGGCSGKAGAGDDAHNDTSVSLRVTPQHLMYSRLGQLNNDSCEWNASPATVRPAESLLSSCKCPAHMSHCSHRKAVTRLVAVAESGYEPTRTETAGSEDEVARWKMSRATLPAVLALQLSSIQEWWAFLNVLGFWLGAGRLQYDDDGQPQSLRFGPRTGSDRTWLANQLHTLGLVVDRLEPMLHSQDSMDGDTTLVTDARWINWFVEEFGTQNAASQPLTPTSHSATRLSSHLPRSPTASPLSPPSSPSSSRLSYCSDDGPDLHTSHTSDTNLPDHIDNRKRKRSNCSHSKSTFNPLVAEPSTLAECDVQEARSCTMTLPNWLMMQLTASEMRLVIGSLWRAAGSWESGQKRIRTSDLELRDQLQQALLHCGYSPRTNLACHANTPGGYQRSIRDNPSVDTSTHAHDLSDDETAQYEPAQDSPDCWAVTWMDLSSQLDERSSWPTLMRQRDVSLVDYDRERDGRMWCVNVHHPDHLILAQRAYRCKDGRVTKQSRPIIVGNCAPVWDSTRRKYVGLLSVSDFLDILLATANEADRTLFLSLSQQRLCDWAEFKRRRGTSISRLLCISPESTLHEAVRQLLNYRVHRLCVVQLALADTILRILTNHGILRFLRQCCPQMASVSVRDLGIGVFENLLTLTYQTPISRAMEMLSMYRVNSIPVVDAHGRPVDVYSRSDVRYLAMDNAWTNLDTSIEQALQPHQHGRTLPLCTRDDTLQTVAGLLIACNKHSLICVHPVTGVVEGVVSLTDIFSFILNTGPPQAESRVAALRADLERERGGDEDAQTMATAAGAGQLSEEELIRRGLTPSLEGALAASVVRSGRKGMEDSEMGDHTIPEDEDFLR